jgi:plastocyanin
MKKLLLPLVALLALAGAAPVVARDNATVAVRITKTGFSPAKVTVRTGDYVTWKNTDTKNHQVVANGGAFVSRILAPGQSYTFQFKAAATYHYHDGLYPTLKGTVVVTGPPPAVSLTASTPVIVYGQSIVLSGAVSNHNANETITIFQRPFGQVSFAELTTVRSAAGGVWNFVGVKPTILTDYMVRWKSTASQPVTIGVAPQVGIGYKRGVLYTRVRAATSYAGKSVLVQRLSRFGQWVTIRKLTLGKRSGRIVRLRLPRGVSRLRVAMSVNQAGPGYQAGFSPTITVRRR